MHSPCSLRNSKYNGGDREKQHSSQTESSKSQDTGTRDVCYDNKERSCLGTVGERSVDGSLRRQEGHSRRKEDDSAKESKDLEKEKEIKKMLS